MGERAIFQIETTKLPPTVWSNNIMQAVESYLDELVWIAENPTNTTAATDAVTVVLDLKNVVFNEILEQDFGNV